ncbi:MAG: HlyD family efflux transporter periplasmic adaptor subunit [Bacteroidota bacterium]
MKNYLYTLGACLGMLVCTSCTNGESADAYGNFEATTITISAEGTGVLTEFRLNEGEMVTQNERIALIDTAQLFLEKRLVEAQLLALQEKIKDASSEIEVLEKQKENLERERNRTRNLVDQNAATQKQLDDYNGEIEVVSRQIASLTEQTQITNRGILAESRAMKAQIAVINQRISDHMVTNPVPGTVLTVFVEANEFVNRGMPLYKVADLSTMILKAYTSAKLLQGMQIGEEVRVLIDKNEEEYIELPGRIRWIAEEAEFTPESIQTKEARVDLVYALEIEVPNNGTLRIGMPGEVMFDNE